MSHQAPHFRKRKAGIRKHFADFQAQIDPSADRIWSIGHIIYKRQQELAKSFRNQDAASFDYIDMISQTSESTRSDLRINEETSMEVCSTTPESGEKSTFEIFNGDSEISQQFIRLNVGGQRFMLKKETVRKRGVGRLFELINKSNESADAYFSPSNEYYFERPPMLFHIVYQFYLNGIIHQPTNLCPMDIIEELEYWKIIADNHLASCCCAQQQDVDEDELEDEEEKPNMFKTLKFGETRRTIWNMIEEPGSGGKAQIFAIFSVFFVLVSISGLVLGSLPDLQHERIMSDGTLEREPLPFFGYIEYCCIIWFTMEYGMKMLVSADRVGTFRQLLNIIDLLAILPFLIEMLLFIFGISTDQLRDLKGAFLVIRILRVLRVIRVLKLGRYSSGLQMFGKTLKASFRQLGMMAMVVMTGVIFFSTLVYFLEKDEPETKFLSIPAACWWCIVTMTTVGYGDLTPVTVPGKLVATGAIACGVLVLALPITIIVDNFMKVAETERPGGGNRFRTTRQTTVIHQQKKSIDNSSEPLHISTNNNP